MSPKRLILKEIHSFRKDLVFSPLAKLISNEQKHISALRNPLILNSKDVPMQDKIGAIIEIQKSLSLRKPKPVLVLDL